MWGYCKLDNVQVEEKGKQCKSGGGGGKASEMLRSRKGRRKMKKCLSSLPSLTCTICAPRMSEPELEMIAAAGENLPNNYGTTQSFYVTGELALIPSMK